MSILEDLLYSYPNGLTDRDGWDYRALSSNNQLTSRYVRDNIDKKWDKFELLCNPNLDTELRLIILRDYIESRRARNSDDESEYDEDSWSDSDISDGDCDDENGQFIDERLGSRIIPDDEIIQILVDEPKMKDELQLLCGNPRLRVDQLEAIFYNHRDLTDWEHAQCNCSLENLKWLLGNPDCSDIIDYRDISFNKNIDNSIIDWLLCNKREESLGELIIYRNLRHHHIIQLLNSEELSRDHLIEILSHSTHSDITRMIITRYPELMDSVIVLTSLGSIAIDEELADEWLYLHPRDSRLGSNPNLTTQNLVNYLNKISEIDDRFKFRAAGIYLGRDRYMDIEVIKTLIELGVNIGDVHNMMEYQSTIDLLENNSDTIRFKLGDREGIPYIIFFIEVDNLESLKLISKLELDKCLIKCSPLSEIIEFISNKRDLIKYIDWIHLSSVTHQDIITLYPSLPWDVTILSSRKYQPSKRLWSTKSARKE